MAELRFDRAKKLPRVRRLASLGSLRREIVRCYDELRAAGADPTTDASTLTPKSKKLQAGRWMR